MEQFADTASRRRILAREENSPRDECAFTRDFRDGQVCYPTETDASGADCTDQRERAEKDRAGSAGAFLIDFPYLWGRVCADRSIVWGAGLVDAPNSGELEDVDVSKGRAAEMFASFEKRVPTAALAKVRFTHKWGGPIAFRENFRPVFGHHPENSNGIVLGVRRAWRGAVSLSWNLGRGGTAGAAGTAKLGPHRFEIEKDTLFWERQESATRLSLGFCPCSRIIPPTSKVEMRCNGSEVVEASGRCFLPRRPRCRQFPAEEALSFLRETRGVTTWTARDMADSLKIGVADAKRVIPILEPTRLRQTGRGNDLDMTTVSRQRRFRIEASSVHQQRVAQALDKLRGRIAEINRDLQSALQDHRGACVWRLHER